MEKKWMLYIPDSGDMPLQYKGGDPEEAIREVKARWGGFPCHVDLGNGPEECVLWTRWGTGTNQKTLRVHTYCGHGLNITEDDDD